MGLFVVLMLAAAPTRPETAAEQFFREGRRALQEGRIADACTAFDQSHRVDPALGTLLNLADCEALLGHEVKAYGLFQEVLAWSRRAKNAEREQVALQRLADLRAKVALVVVDAPADARVEIDGQPVVAGTQVPLSPGTHEVVVTNGAEVRTQTLAVKAGALVAAKPDVVPPVDGPKAVPLIPSPEPVVPVAVAAAATPVVEVKRRSSAPGIGLLGAGAAVLIAGIVGTVYSVGVWQQVERQRVGGPDYAQPTVTQSEYGRAAVVYPVAVTAVIVGGVAAVAGGAVLIGGSF